MSPTFVRSRNMMIRQHTNNVSAPKVLKVTLSTDLHLHLHRLKILTGRGISDTVSEALVAYFATMQVDRELARSASQTGPPGAFRTTTDASANVLAAALVPAATVA